MTSFKTVLIAIGENPKPGVHTGISEFPEWVAQYLADHGIDNVHAPCATREDLEKYASDADVVWMYSGTRILTAENIPVLRKCGAILKVGSGVDNIDVEAATRLGIIVANTPEVVVGPVAEHTIALLLAASRNVAYHNHLVRNGQWGDKSVYDLEKSTLGLIGFGRVGQRIVQKLTGFGMNFLAYDPFVSAADMQRGGAWPVTIEELLSQSDFVSIHCNLTPQTRGLIKERELRMMKKNAILVNVSRGAVVDEQALYRALSEGWIAGAALDVMEKEPPDADNPLLGLDNVIITPHVAGKSSSSPNSGWRAMCAALVTMSKHRWPDSVVNKGVKPRWQWLEPRE